MSKSKGFALRLPEHERERAQALARELGISENRLYAELIHDGLLMREQMHYMTRLRELGSAVSREEALALLDKVPDVEPDPVDRF